MPARKGGLSGPVSDVRSVATSAPNPSEGCSYLAVFRPVTFGVVTSVGRILATMTEQVCLEGRVQGILGASTSVLSRRASQAAAAEPTTADPWKCLRPAERPRSGRRPSVRSRKYSAPAR